MRYSNKQLLLSSPSGGTESSEIVHMYFIVCNGQSVKTHIKNIFSQDLSTAGNFGRKQQLQRRFPEQFPVSPWKRVYAGFSFGSVSAWRSPVFPWKEVIYSFALVSIMFSSSYTALSLHLTVIYAEIILSKTEVRKMISGEINTYTRFYT